MTRQLLRFKLIKLFLFIDSFLKISLEFEKRIKIVFQKGLPFWLVKWSGKEEIISKFLMLLRFFSKEEKKRKVKRKKMFCFKIQNEGKVILSENC